MRNPFTFVFFLMLLSTITSQNQWKSTLTEPYFEVDDIAILKDNSYYLSLRKTHEIFESRDSGVSWKALGPFETKYSNYSLKSLELVNDELVVINYPNSRGTELYNLGNESKLIKQKAGVFLVPKFTKIDKEGNLFYVEGDNIFPINLNLELERFNKIISTSYLLQTFMYNTENNYIVARNFSSKDTFRIVKFNSKTGEFKLHSMFFDDIRPEDIVVSENGSVVYRASSNRILCARFDNPFSYKEEYLESNGEPKYINSIQLTASGEVFILTNSGIFMTDGIQINKWFKCFQMSQNLPLSDENDVSYHYCFKDSLSAIISYETICGASRVYSFSPKFKQWKEVELDIHLENIIDLKADKEGRLYGFRPCDTWQKTRYVISENQGKTWRYLKLFGYEVNGLAINNEGNAVAIILNKEVFIHNPSTNTWDNILTSSVIKPNVKVYHCYAIGKDLILEGIIEGVSPQNINFYSEDDGKSWQTTTTPAKRIDQTFPSMETLVDQQGNWLIYNSKFNYGEPFEVMISSDKGKTWKTDPRFSQLRDINEVIKLNDGRFLVSARGNPLKYNNEYKVFILNNAAELDVISPDFDKKSYSMKSLSSGSIIGYSELTSGLDQPLILFTMNDSSFQYTYSYTGLGHSPDDSWLIKSAVVGKDNQIFLSLAMDGIYTNTTDLSINVKNPKLDKGLKLNYNFSNDLIILKDEDGNLNKYAEYSIFNNLGCILSKGKLPFGGIISLSNLSVGVYHLVVFDKNQNSKYFKFVKY
ncbi:MAG: sialidase family protein [Saprospiraceae bacterium]